MKIYRLILYSFFVGLIYFIACNSDSGPKGDSKNLIEKKNTNKSIINFSSLNKIDGNPPFWIDGINGKPYKKELIIVEEDSFSISGWTVDNLNETIATAIYIEIDGDTIKLNSGESRKDIALVLNNENYRNAGFSGNFSVKGKENGLYSIKFLILTNNGYYSLEEKNNIYVYDRKIDTYFDSLIRLDDLPLCWIDQINGETLSSDKEIIINTDRIELKGWAIDKLNQSAASAVFAVVNGRKFKLMYGELREDLALSYNNQVYKNAGFSGVIPNVKLHSKIDDFQLYVIGKDKKNYFVSDFWNTNK